MPASFSTRVYDRVPTVSTSVDGSETRKRNRRYDSAFSVGGFVSIVNGAVRVNVPTSSAIVSASVYVPSGAGVPSARMPFHVSDCGPGSEDVTGGVTSTAAPRNTWKTSDTGCRV